MHLVVKFDHRRRWLAWIFRVQVTLEKNGVLVAWEPSDGEVLDDWWYSRLMFLVHTVEIVYFTWVFNPEI